MHLLAATPGQMDDGSEAIDLAQDPGDILVLSAADTELACLAAARERLGASFPTTRLANLMFLSHPMSVDLYLEQTAAHAKLILARVIGGMGYWRYGLEQLSQLCATKKISLVVVPGDDQPDPELARLCTLPPEQSHQLWQYFVHGGLENSEQALRFAASLLPQEPPARQEDRAQGEPAWPWHPPQPLLRAGLYSPQKDILSFSDLTQDWAETQPVAAIVFYRALVQSGSLAPVKALIEALEQEGFNTLPLYVSSLKESGSAAFVRDMLGQAKPAVILNATAFALSEPGGPTKATAFDAADCPVFQIIFSSGAEAQWREGTHGLSARDIAMHVALPEVDGRILTRALSFKAEAQHHVLTQCPIVTYAPVQDRIVFTAKLAASWASLRQKTVSQRRIALILANYPNKDGRIANGVGLDSPASALAILKAMAEAGYDISTLPETSDDLIRNLQQGPTNDFKSLDDRQITERLSLADYQAFLKTHVSETIVNMITERWGAPEQDPFVRDNAFALPALRFGQACLAIQPARGYHLDPATSYHDPALVPPHHYLAFYAWLRWPEAQGGFGADAVIHVGKHGNLEWLPGKALALSAECFPEVALGPLPNLYPFIVNDPGEGSQAKRRNSAVIIDHLTPPLTRAGSYGPLRDLETLIDEYYEAAGLDPRRCKLLREDILSLSHHLGLDRDIGIQPQEEEDSALAKLDNHLCELKEMQIRDGLHILGQSPQGSERTRLLAALLRAPRGDGKHGNASLTRALAADLGLDQTVIGPETPAGEATLFDPLNSPMAALWTGPRPDCLHSLSEKPWRSLGDTIERLEDFAEALIAGTVSPPAHWSQTQAVLEQAHKSIAPALDQSGAEEQRHLLRALDGRFVPPGPSGAPTRGRPEVLPTGRNFYSVDSRAVPTAAAWRLGWASAQLIIDRYTQDNGFYPTSLALSAWGTANMRTGGDDIAQALALIGARPQWEQTTGRVTGFEVLPLAMLNRPRVDVTLRISGFFRDAFPGLIDLFDRASRTIATLDEPEDQNPLAAKVQKDMDTFRQQGLSEKDAQRKAGFRIFGSQPGAYGAGLQALIDEKGWESGDDLAKAYLAWGGFAYGADSKGQKETHLFAQRLQDVELVLHNQDNREHDLLDSDDYYQFEGGLTATVSYLSGQEPQIYHNDHSRPESPHIRSLQEEIGRVVRARCVNPKWIAGVMRHGYKGAFEIAATVDYLFAFAATTSAVSDAHFEALHDAYVADPEVMAFLQDHNPVAAKEIAARLKEAIDRGLWRPRRNAVLGELESLLI